jgi:glycosyltransferase involved in cell wall biosynthesis
VVEISVIIPTMNEEASIGAVIDEVRRALASRDLEILTVDTNSRDRTNEIAAAKGARVIAELRRGYGRAYMTGFAAARGTYILALDGDETYPASRFPEFLRPLDEDRADFVAGDRITLLSEDAMSGMHRVGNTMLNLAFRLLFRSPIRDSQSGMWAFRRAILPRLHLIHDGMAFSEELKIEVVRNGFRYLEIPVEYRVRVGDKKIRSVRDAFGNMVWLFRKRFGWAHAGARSSSERALGPATSPRGAGPPSKSR